MRFVVLAAFVLAASFDVALAQSWHGLRPLESTCDDVKRELGVDKCNFPESVYDLKEETVTVRFVTCPCAIRCYDSTRGWNVPRGTLLSIRRNFPNPRPVSESEFDISADKWSSFETDMIGHRVYSSDKDNISLSVLNGDLLTVSYDPDFEKHKDKRCRTKCRAPVFGGVKDIWLLGYGDVDIKVEEARLDRFANELKEHGKGVLGYIVAFDGCLQKGQAAARAKRAKKYLVSIKGIDPRQVIILNGGQRETIDFLLHVRSRRSPPPRISSYAVYPKS